MSFAAREQRGDGIAGRLLFLRNSSPQRVGPDACRPCKFWDRHAVAIVLDAFRCALVVRLFYRGGPTAIPGLVMTTWIDSVKRSYLKWFLAHVSDEALERAPRTTDPNAAPAIQMVVLGSRIFAAAAHVLPRGVFSRESSAPSMAMRGAHADSGLALQATATPRFAEFQVAASNRARLPAVASTDPVRLQGYYCRAAKHGESPEATARNIDKCRHAPLYHWWQTWGELRQI